ncbi:MAG: DUF6788 family protein [Patescibacteria group bacterium]
MAIDARRLEKIDQEIERIKRQLGRIGVVRPGSLTRQYKDPKHHTGGYYQVSYTHRMKSRTAYVQATFATEVRQQIREYKKLKTLIERWVALGIEHSQLSMRLRSSR